MELASYSTTSFPPHSARINVEWSSAKLWTDGGASTETPTPDTPK